MMTFKRVLGMCGVSTLFAIGSLTGCSSDGDSSPAAGGSHAGGGNGSGGAAAGTAAGGKNGAAGSSSTGGKSGSMGGSGGQAGSAGRATGGEPNAGAGGEGVGGDGAAGEGGEGGEASATLDTCFEGLRALEGSSQISTRSNTAEKVELRLALETADRFGTSGTVPWDVVRAGLLLDGELICLQEAQLKDAYMGSHHNCADSLVLTVGSRRFEIAHPDAPNASTFTLFVADTKTRGPLNLTTTECVQGGGASKECRSGGPC